MSRLLQIAAAEFWVSEYNGTNRITDYHTVNKGENLYRICLTNNVSVNDVMAWNSMRDYIVYPGQQLRLSQRDGNISNPRILQYAKELTAAGFNGFSAVRSDQDAWCSLFLCWCAMKLGLQHPNSLLARDWLKVGTRVDFDTNKADVAVFWREDRNSIFGHAGIPLCYSEDRTLIHTIGGNQSNRVCEKPYPVDRLLGFIQL